MPPVDSSCRRRRWAATIRSSFLLTQRTLPPSEHLPVEDVKNYVQIHNQEPLADGKGTNTFEPQHEEEVSGSSSSSGIKTGQVSYRLLEEREHPSPYNVRGTKGADRTRKQQAPLFIVLFVAFFGLSRMEYLLGNNKKLNGSSIQSKLSSFSTITYAYSTTEARSLSSIYLPPPPPNVTVGVYYYPWHDPIRKFHGGRYLRKHLKQYPLLGEYNDRYPATISQHLAWSREYNIRAWITSWWGPTSIEDDTIRNVILPHKDLGDHKIAIHYESIGRSSNEDNGVLNSTLILQGAGSDVTYLCKEYFKHPNYLRIDGRPVLIFYLSRLFEELGVMRDVATLMRTAAAECGENLYLVGDHTFGTAILPFDYLDAVTNYDVYGSTVVTNGYANQSGVQNYATNQQKWRNATQQQGVHYIPSACPGFNDKSVRKGNGPMSRKLSPDSDFGSLFEESLRQALELIDPATQNMLLVNSFNEWHEDTQIEPVVGVSTNQPPEVTQGLEYEGYGFLYLDILRRMSNRRAKVTNSIVTL